MGRRLFDSNVLIDALNGVLAALAVLEARGSTRCISIMTWLEVMAGTADVADELRARALLSRMEVLPLSPAITEDAWRVRRDSRLKLVDAIILATARVERIPLYTRSTKDFDPSDPSIVVPYTV
ncbi:MAG: PIN domain-containing protein [Dehalococcoidia bacterium]